MYATCVDQGKPIYYSICPHTKAPGVGTGAPYHGASVYSPPAVWTKAQRHALANSLLVEYTNSFDLWYADPTPAVRESHPPQLAMNH